LQAVAFTVTIIGNAYTLLCDCVDFCAFPPHLPLPHISLSLSVSFRVRLLAVHAGYTSCSPAASPYSSLTHYIPLTSLPHPAAGPSSLWALCSSCCPSLVVAKHGCWA
jgi:hypothetical protein